MVFDVVIFVVLTFSPFNCLVDKEKVNIVKSRQKRKLGEKWIRDEPVTRIFEKQSLIR